MKKSKIKWKIPTKTNSKIKQRMNEILQELGVSKQYFKKTMPKVTGTGSDFKPVEPPKGRWGRQKAGKKPNLRQQLKMLEDLLELDRELKADMEKQKESIEKDQAIKSAMLEQDGEGVSKDDMAGLVESVFDRNH